MAAKQPLKVQHAGADAHVDAHRPPPQEHALLPMNLRGTHAIQLHRLRPASEDECSSSHLQQSPDVCPRDLSDAHTRDLEAGRRRQAHSPIPLPAIVHALVARRRPHQSHPPNALFIPCDEMFAPSVWFFGLFVHLPSADIKANKDTFWRNQRVVETFLEPQTS